MFEKAKDIQDIEAIQPKFTYKITEVYTAFTTTANKPQKIPVSSTHIIRHATLLLTTLTPMHNPILPYSHSWTSSSPNPN